MICTSAGAADSIDCIAVCIAGRKLVAFARVERVVDHHRGDTLDPGEPERLSDRSSHPDNISDVHGVRVVPNKDAFGRQRVAVCVDVLFLNVIAVDVVVVRGVRVGVAFLEVTDDNTFCFCETKYCEDITIFSDRTNRAILRAKENPRLEDEPGRDDYLFISSLPWVHFTAVTHPVHMSPVDSIPRITWGRFTEVHKRVIMPLSVQVHHGLADGYHVGRFFELLQLWVESVDLSKPSSEDTD